MNSPFALSPSVRSAAQAIPVPPPPDLEAIKQRQQATWASGDYAVIGTTLQIVGESLAEAVNLQAGERVLDVAAGNGNATLSSGPTTAPRTRPSRRWTARGRHGSTPICCNCSNRVTSAGLARWWFQGNTSKR
jgi:hypothetical protein